MERQVGTAGGRRVGLVVCTGILTATLIGVAQEQLGTFERIVVSSTAVGIASATTNPSGRSQMNTCSARLESAGARFRDDGTNPTADVGGPLEVGDVLTIPGNVIARRIRFIRSSSGDAILSVRCYP